MTAAEPTPPAELEEFELAFARLDWVREATTCLGQPGQQNALRWHQACCDAALSALNARELNRDAC